MKMDHNRQRLAVTQLRCSLLLRCSAWQQVSCLGLIYRFAEIIDSAEQFQ
jgi:hypothetical protein